MMAMGCIRTLDAWSSSHCCHVFCSGRLVFLMFRDFMILSASHPSSAPVDLERLRIHYRVVARAHRRRRHTNFAKDWDFKLCHWAISEVVEVTGPWNRDGTTGFVVFADFLFEQTANFIDKDIHPVRVANRYYQACDITSTDTEFSIPSMPQRAIVTRLPSWSEQHEQGKRTWSHRCGCSRWRFVWRGCESS